MANHTLGSENSSGNDWDENDNGPPLYARIVFACAWILIAVAGITGNSLVIFVAVRFQKMTNVTNCFIVNLAITDIVFLAFCMPLLVVQYTMEHWFFDQIICKLLNFISFVSVLVTVLTLVVMTIDRYIYVVRPFADLKWRKPRTVLLLSIVIWLISCIFASPFYHHYGVESSPDDHRQCVLLTDERFQKYFRIYTVTVYYFIPLTIIIISYTSLLYFVYSKENKLNKHTKYTTIRRTKRRRAVTKMVAIVTLVFAICWLPITLYIMSASVFKHRTPLLYYFKILANSFAYLNSAVNPILYAFLNRSFRNNCGSLFMEPSCSLFCADEFRQAGIPQEQKRLRNRLPSTQIDRFSYQSTNYPSALSTQDKKKKIVTIVNPGNQLSIDIIPHNDFSDGDQDVSDVESSNPAPVVKNSVQNYQQLIAEESIGPQTLTTSL